MVETKKKEPLDPKFQPYRPGSIYTLKDWCEAETRAWIISTGVPKNTVNKRIAILKKQNYFEGMAERLREIIRKRGEKIKW